TRDGCSFDHLVGACQECLWNRETQRLDGRQIDDEFELGRLLDGKVSGFRPFENFVNKVTRMAELVCVVCAIGHEASRSEKVTGGMKGRQSRAQRESVDPSMSGIYQRAWTSVQRLRPDFERLESRCNIGRAAYFEHVDIKAKFTGCGLNLRYLQYRA